MAGLAIDAWTIDEQMRLVHFRESGLVLRVLESLQPGDLLIGVLVCIALVGLISCFIGYLRGRQRTPLQMAIAALILGVPVVLLFVAVEALWTLSF